MATAKKMKSGNWRIQPQKTLSTGKKIRTSITAPTKKEAERLAVLWETETEEQNNCKLTLQDALNAFVETCKSQGYSPSTIKTYSARAVSSYPDLNECRLDSITTSMVQKQIDSRSKYVQPITIRADIAFLKQSVSPYTHNIDFSKLVISKKTKRKKLEMKQNWKTEIPLKMIELFGKDDQYLYIILIIYAGLRPSESYALTWGDISKEPKIVNGTKIGYISVSKATVQNVEGSYSDKGTKSESGNRKVSVSWSLIEELLSVHPRGNDTDRIIQELPNNTFKLKWKKIKEELNLPESMRRYDLRHFFATQLVISGATEEELQQQMGHSASSFTHNVYVEIMQEHKKETTTKFAVNSTESLKILRNSR